MLMYLADVCINFTEKNINKGILLQNKALEKVKTPAFYWYFTRGKLHRILAGWWLNLAALIAGLDLL